MTEIKSYQIKDIKISLNVKVGKDAPKWSVAVNKSTVRGGTVTSSYQRALSAFHTLERALDVIARDSWGYETCGDCSELVPGRTKTEIWYDAKDGTGESYREYLCVDCIDKHNKAGALQEWVSER